LKGDPAFRVLVTTPYVTHDHAEAIALLEQAGCQLTFSYYDPARPNRPPEELVSAAQGMDGILAGNDPWTRQVLGQLPRLRAISRFGVGYDRVDVEAATELGIAVANAPKGLDQAVAEFTVGLILALSRHIVTADRLVRQHAWSTLTGRDVAGTTLGLVGFGAIGRRVARLVQGFRMRILAHDVAFDRAAAQELGVVRADLVEVLGEADCVSLHVPLLPATRGLIGEPELRRMKSSSYLINTARGPIVDEAALVRALRERWIAGAALDVFAHEPYRDGPLLTLDNVIVTSHIAGSSHQADHACRLLACENLVALLRREPCSYVVNSEVRARPR
jgi:D-3-phosphoglycerate dehydrogenase